MGLLLNEVGALVTEDTEKAELLSTFFISVIIAETAPGESRTLQKRERIWGKEDFSMVKEDLVRDHLCKPDAHKSMRQM